MLLHHVHSPKCPQLFAQDPVYEGSDCDEGDCVELSEEGHVELKDQNHQSCMVRSLGFAQCLASCVHLSNFCYKLTVVHGGTMYLGACMHLDGGDDVSRYNSVAFRYTPASALLCQHATT